MKNYKKKKKKEICKQTLTHPQYTIKSAYPSSPSFALRSMDRQNRLIHVLLV
jgi:hypothetical protein